MGGHFDGGIKKGLNLLQTHYCFVSANFWGFLVLFHELYLLFPFFMLCKSLSELGADLCGLVFHK